MATLTLGLSKIEVGEIAEDGDVAESFAALGKTYQDTASITDEDPEVIEHFSEEDEAPLAVIRRRGRRTISFSIMNPNKQTLVDTLGGTLTGVAPNQVWNEPATMPVIERSIRITPAIGSVVTFPRVSLSGKINYELSKSGIMLIEMTADVLQPTKSGVASTQIA